MRAFRAIVELTLRALVGRRRTLTIALLAVLPVLLGILVRVGGGRPDAPEILDTLVIRTVCPLVALVIGTGAIGSEIDDGTLIFQLIKPVPRWVVAVAKTAVAAFVTAVLVVPPVVVSGLLLGGLGAESIGTTIGFAIAALAGGTAYAVGFTALGLMTSRALVVGLGYTLIWEGVLAGLLEGTRFLSVRQATLGIAAELTGEDVGVVPLAMPISVGIIAVVIVGGVILTATRLRRFQIRAAD
ncbi:MAG TPA: ABC transporter permease subunit [Candidatus Limnocylindrales bacterium]|jgi:ABC-2 type transport system permease protein|nr:ABC transporter permease subunit [Candidatus Limnocylindrales bacterium]